ncbi:MAG: protease inhibitor I42 family protein [Acidaminococcaceae bacterium]|nr:protease inhibitor I42 family protein [Acidaminococcaceae bacterium]
MKKTCILTLLLLLFTVNAWAFGQSTIMENVLSNGKRQGTIPMIDGVHDINVQKSINELLNDAAEKLGKDAGGQVKLSYEVTLNRPTMLSVVLQASGDKTLYKGLNIDIISGKECNTKDFFYLKDAFVKTLASRSYVFSEEGLLLSSGNGAAYSEKLPYTSILQYLNIASCARFMTGYKVTGASEGKTLHLQVGSLVSLYLPSNPSTGFDWYMSESNKPDGFVSMGSSLFIPINTRANVTGVPGNTILFFGFTKPGKYKLVFEYKRPWAQNADQAMTYDFFVQ